MLGEEWRRSPKDLTGSTFCRVPGSNPTYSTIYFIQFNQYYKITTEIGKQKVSKEARTGWCMLKHL